MHLKEDEPVQYETILDRIKFLETEKSRLISENMILGAEKTFLEAEKTILKAEKIRLQTRRNELLCIIFNEYT